MPNELFVGAAAVGLAAIAMMFARFIRPRVGEVVREADPDLRARLSLQELQRPPDSMRRADDTEVGR